MALSIAACTLFQQLRWNTVTGINDSDWFSRISLAQSLYDLLGNKGMKKERRQTSTTHCQQNESISQVEMFAEESINRIASNEQEEFEFYMLWDWPEHIEQALRRMLWIALVEAAEDSQSHNAHTCMLRWIIAGYPDSPPEVLEFLSDFTDPTLLKRVADNPRAAASTLQKLAGHSDIDVLLAVADNSNTPLSTLLEMSLKAGLDVRYRLAENPALPAKLLQQLAADTNTYVSWRAQRTLVRRNPPAVQVFPVRQDRDRHRKAM